MIKDVHIRLATKTRLSDSKLVDIIGGFVEMVGLMFSSGVEYEIKADNINDRTRVDVVEK